MSCEPNPDCPYFETGCYEDTHHLFYNKARYRTGIEKRFRTLACNVIELCRHEHRELHAKTPNGVLKPSRNEMLEVLNREERIDRSRRDVGKSAEKAHEVQIVIEGLNE